MKPPPTSQTKPEIMIGIDTGVNTGLAIWNTATKQFVFIGSVMIHEGFDMVLSYHRLYKVKVRVEDARQVRFNIDVNKVKGTASVRRDAKAWEDFLTGHNIPFEMVRPDKKITKWNAADFKTRTKYAGSTNSHGRDAALLVYDY